MSLVFSEGLLPLCRTGVYPDLLAVPGTSVLDYRYHSRASGINSLHTMSPHASPQRGSKGKYPLVVRRYFTWVHTEAGRGRPFGLGLVPSSPAAPVCHHDHSSKGAPCRFHTGTQISLGSGNIFSGTLYSNSINRASGSTGKLGWTRKLQCPSG